MTGITHKLHISAFITFVLLCANMAKAQDSLRMHTGAVYSVKIIEISDDAIKYRTYNNPDGPLYTVSKSTVYEMKVESQTWEKVSANLPSHRAGDTRKKDINTEMRTHYIGANLLDFIRTDLTVYYEWVFKNKIGLRIPVTYGFRSGHFNPNTTISNPFGFKRNTVFKTGLDLRIYSGQGQRRVRFVFGPAIYYLRLNRIPSDYGTAAPDYMVFRSAHAIRLMFFNGIIIKPAEFIQFGFDAGFGGDIDFGENSNPGFNSYYITSTPTVPKAQFNLHIGYRF